MQRNLVKPRIYRVYIERRVPDVGLDGKPRMKLWTRYSSGLLKGHPLAVSYALKEIGRIRAQAPLNAGAIIQATIQPIT